MSHSIPLNPDFSETGLPPLPTIEDGPLEERVFVHRSLHGRSNVLFQDPEDDPDPSDNERLEFLGDSILNCVAASLLQENFPRLRVGPASKARAYVISNENLSGLCKHYNLQSRLNGFRAQLKVLQLSSQVQADLFESYIAGVYLDTRPLTPNQPRGFQRVREWLDPLLTPYMKEAVERVMLEHRGIPLGGTLEDGELPASAETRALSPTNSQTFGSTPDEGTLSYFNQYCQKNKKKIDWRAEESEGTKATPMWKVSAYCGKELLGVGYGTAKKAAKLAAAKAAMNKWNIVME